MLLMITILVTNNISKLMSTQYVKTRSNWGVKRDFPMFNEGQPWDFNISGKKKFWKAPTSGHHMGEKKKREKKKNSLSLFFFSPSRSLFAPLHHFFWQHHWRNSPSLLSSPYLSPSLTQMPWSSSLSPLLSLSLSWSLTLSLFNVRSFLDRLPLAT